MKTFGLAIPACDSYIPYLEKLLRNISEQTVIPDEVSISISEVDKYTPKEDYGLNLIITSHRDKKGGAENRNIASDKLSTDIISFMDCDDLMHPQRTEFIKKSFTSETLAVVHDYEISETQIWKKNVYNETEFLEQKWNYVSINHNVIDTVSDKHLFPISNTYDLSYHNAHVSISKQISEKYKYDKTHVFPDSLFNRTLVEDGVKITHIGNKLSYYFLK